MARNCSWAKNPLEIQSLLKRCCLRLAQINFSLLIMQIKIRFNTDKDRRDPTLPPWRVFIDGVEHLADHVEIHTRVWTTQDEVEPGVFKWHITCEGQVHWDKAKRNCKIT